jgi:hypothetical protein
MIDTQVLSKIKKAQS